MPSRKRSSSPREAVSYSELIPTQKLSSMAAPYNPRQMPDREMDALTQSLRYFGPVQPIVVNKRSQHIVGGHQRVRAAQALGLEQLPVVWVDLDDPSEKQLNLALNRISGTWDDEKLREVLQGLEADGAELSLTGFEDAELARLLQKVEEGETSPDAVPEDVPERVQKDDVWELGRHKLLCGDATNFMAVRAILVSDTPVLCVTDPPYGVEYDAAWRNEAAEKGQIAYAAKRMGPVANDTRSDWSEVWKTMPCDVLYHWSASGEQGVDVAVSIMESGFSVRNMLVWRKPFPVISRGHYNGQHEVCWYAVKDGSSAHWIGEKNATTVWDVARDENVPGGHSTQKPVELFRRAIANHQGDVFEPFAGSGTCLIACEQLGRRCYAVEIEPHYCDVILARWEAFTGQEAKRVSPPQ